MSKDLLNPEDGVKLSPEALTVVNNYLETNDISATSNLLKMPREKVIQYLNKKESRRYIDTVFMYAGSYSLSRELNSVQDFNEMSIGDVFIEGGFPGHTVMVVDMAINRRTGRKLFLLIQSFMPAQDIHILRNLTNPMLDPWYELDFGETLHTPEWTFNKKDLKRF